MKLLTRRLTFLLACGVLCALSGTAAAAPPAAARNWEARLAELLPTLGHRNWIVVADSAYPAQSRQGIDTFYIGGDQLEAVQRVLAIVKKAKHVQPVVYVDAELDAVAEDDAPGIGQYRNGLKALLGDHKSNTEPHEAIIAKLDEAAKTFRVVILKTDLTLPYTSVFLELDCGYWSSEKERRLRESLK